MIELVHLEKKYERATPLEDVNAVINDGDIRKNHINAPARRNSIWN